MIDLTGKVALVTGGASGIGNGICRVLAEQGADIVVADINVGGAEVVAKEMESIGRKSNAIRLDVTDPESVTNVVAQVISDFGKIDILVNDAGVSGTPGSPEESDAGHEDWDFIMAINLRGLVRVSETVAPHMIRQGHGKIVNIASIAARQGGAAIPYYGISKAGVVSWTQSHALQLAEHNINVNAICPGLLWTPLFEKGIRRMIASGASIGSSPELLDLSGRDYFNRLVEEMIPMKKEQTPQDIGKMAAFLASDDAHNITGQAINVDGGRRMN